MRYYISFLFFFFSSRRRHTRYWRDWSSDVCSSDLPDLYNQIEWAAGRIIGFHIDDWQANENPAASRVMMGDGVIELRRIKTAEEETGYEGAIEDEIFNQVTWEMHGKDGLDEMKEGHVEHVW